MPTEPVPTKSCDKNHELVHYNNIEGPCPVCEVIIRLSDAIAKIEELENQIKELGGEE